jgi:exonuclease III
MAGDNNSVVKILTLNVNGINKPSKRAKLYEFLKLEKIDIAFLQETYLTHAAIKKAKAEWEGESIWNPGLTNAKGTAILFSPLLDISITYQTRDTNGRLIKVVCQMQDSKLCLINVYCPVEEREKNPLPRKLTRLPTR